MSSTDPYRRTPGGTNSPGMGSAIFERYFVASAFVIAYQNATEESWGEGPQAGCGRIGTRIGASAMGGPVGVLRASGAVHQVGAGSLVLDLAGERLEPYLPGNSAMSLPRM